MKKKQHNKALKAVLVFILAMLLAVITVTDVFADDSYNYYGTTGATSSSGTPVGPSTGTYAIQWINTGYKLPGNITGYRMTILDSNGNRAKYDDQDMAVVNILLKEQVNGYITWNSTDANYLYKNAYWFTFQNHDYPYDYQDTIMTKAQMQKAFARLTSTGSDKIVNFDYGFSKDSGLNSLSTTTSGTTTSVKSKLYQEDNVIYAYCDASGFTGTLNYNISSSSTGIQQWIMQGDNSCRTNLDALYKLASGNDSCTATRPGETFVSIEPLIVWYKRDDRARIISTPTEAAMVCFTSYCANKKQVLKDHINDGMAQDDSHVWGTAFSDIATVPVANMNLAYVNTDVKNSANETVFEETRYDSRTYTYTNREGKTSSFPSANYTYAEAIAGNLGHNVVSIYSLATPTTYSGNIYVKLDGNNYTSYNQTIKLKSGSTEITGTKSNNYSFSFSNVPAGTYDIYAGNTDTGKDITISGSFTGYVDYYTLHIKTRVDQQNQAGALGNPGFADWVWLKIGNNDGEYLNSNSIDRVLLEDTPYYVMARQYDGDNDCADIAGQYSEKEPEIIACETTKNIWYYTLHIKTRVDKQEALSNNLGSPDISKWVWFGLGTGSKAGKGEYIGSNDISRVLLWKTPY